MTGHLEKLEDCPECGGALNQAQYDAQWCHCGWGPFAVSHRLVMTEHMRASLLRFVHSSDLPPVGAVLWEDGIWRLPK